MMEDSKKLNAASVSDIQIDRFDMGVEESVRNQGELTSTNTLLVPLPSHGAANSHAEGGPSQEVQRSISLTSKVSAAPGPKRKEYKLKLFIALLLCVMVAGVVTIYHFYNRQQYHLRIGKQIDFDEIPRILRVYNEHGDEVLKGELGLTLPPGMVPYNCEPDDTYEENSCVGWKNKARMYLDYNHTEQINCYHISWIYEESYLYPLDCYEFGDATWYGGMLPVKDDFQNLHFEIQPFVTSTPNAARGFGPVIEPSWLTSKSVALYVEGEPPLHVSVNTLDAHNKTDGRLCLQASYAESPYHNPHNKTPWLNYTICTAPNILDMHKFMLGRFSNNNPIPTTPKFGQAVYSTWPQFKQNINQENVINYVDTLVQNQMAKGIILLEEGWQSKHGDLTFDPIKFPNASDMIVNISSRGFDTAVAVSHMVATDSQAFQTRLNDHSLVKDAGGETEGLINYYIGPHTSMWHRDHTAAIDFSQSAQQLHNSSFLTALPSITDDVTFSGGQTDLLPYQAHFDKAYATPNEYIENYASLITEPWSNVAAAYKTQHMDNFLQLYDANTTAGRELNGYRAVLPQAIALGIMGYPFFVPSPVGGAYYPPFESNNVNLYKRWIELVTFFPVMQFGAFPEDSDYNMVNDYTDKHKSVVMDAINEVLDNATKYLHPIVRPLWWYDPEDARCLEIQDQFLVGTKLLVAPVMEPDDTSRDVYLPHGTWVDQNEDTVYQGPITLSAYSALIDVIPYFLLQS